jgi:hypothetical protein
VVGEIQGRGVLAGVGTPSQNTQASKSEWADGFNINYGVTLHQFYKPPSPAVDLAKFDVGVCSPSSAV